VYAGSPDKYYSFLTPEAFWSLKEWMDYREKHGEKISGESWLMRDLWRTTNVKRGANRSIATNPRQLKSSAIKKLLQRALWAQNLRPVLQAGQRRHSWKTAHGFRKYFKSRAEQIMRPLYVELLMGHSVGGYLIAMLGQLSKRCCKITCEQLITLALTLSKEQRISCKNKFLSSKSKESMKSI
jgi:hypothetical protein